MIRLVSPIEQGEVTVTSRRLWVPVLAALVGALLAVMLVGPLGARGNAGAVEPRTTNRTITIPAGAFSPTDETYAFTNYGSQLWVDSGGGNFAAPLFFEAAEVTIRKITLYAYDNGLGEVCVTLYRTIPATGGEAEMGQACSTSADVTVRAFTQTTLSPRRITGAYGPYLWLDLPGDDTMYRFYAVRITYSY
jgi:hypothetical protein